MAKNPSPEARIHRKRAPGIVTTPSDTSSWRTTPVFSHPRKAAIRKLERLVSSHDMGLSPRCWVGSFRETNRSLNVFPFQLQQVAKVVDVVPLGGRAEICARAALDPVHEKELDIVGFLDLVTGAWRDLVVGHGLDQVGSHQDNQLLLDPVA